MTIKEYRLADGLTQKQFSELFNPPIPLDTIKKWDSGKMNPPEWVQGLIIKRLEEIRMDKNIEIYRYGEKIGEVASITIEDLFDDGLAYGCNAYIKAIHEKVETDFLLVPSISLYTDWLLKKYDPDDEIRLRVDKCDIGRSDYEFYEILVYNDYMEEDEIDDLDRCYVASFLKGSKRKFGSASFRTIKDAALYIKIDENTEGMKWEGEDGKEYTLEDLCSLSAEQLIFHMTLDKYDIFDRNEMCVFERKI